MPALFLWCGEPGRTNLPGYAMRAAIWVSGSYCEIPMGTIDIRTRLTIIDSIRPMMVNANKARFPWVTLTLASLLVGLSLVRFPTPKHRSIGGDWSISLSHGRVHLTHSQSLPLPPPPLLYTHAGFRHDWSLVTWWYLDDRGAIRDSYRSIAYGAGIPPLVPALPVLTLFLRQLRRVPHKQRGFEAIVQTTADRDRGG